MKKKTIKLIKKGLKEAGEVKLERGKVLENDSILFTAESVKNHLNHLKIRWYQYPIRWFNWYFWNYVSSIPLEVKSFIQRGIRGWSDSDTWNFDYYLAKVISEGVEHLRDNGISAYDKKSLIAMKEIIKTFETAKKIMDGDILYISSNKFTWKEYKKYYRYYEKLNKNNRYFSKPMTLRESKRFEKGFDYLRDYYFHLWD